ncbi:MAG TPA: ABC transporter substrate-binding protein, partial [Thermomicrobiales bacterium]|nr:ABC transporter substrate-binding protein [Thermomicrobiales bacterium]
MSDPRWIEVLRALEARKLNRRRLMQTGAAATAAAALPLSGKLAAPGAAAAPRAQTEANQLVVLDSLQTQNWLYMDPGKFYEINPSAALNMLYESLYFIPDGSKIGEIKPLLATDMPTYSSDGLTATIKIRDGVKFQNSGNPMTADDVVWSWYRLKNLKGNPSFLFSDFMDSVKAVD